MISSLYPAEALEAFEHNLIFFCHGQAHYGVKYTLDDFAQAVKDRGAAIGLFGHTHCRDGVTLFNPGSIGAPPALAGPATGLLQLYLKW